MASAKELNTIDDVIIMMDQYLSQIHKFFSERELDQKVAGILSQASDADEIFKSQLVSSYMEQFTRIAMNVAYLKQPVVKEGIFQQKLNGTVELDDEPVSAGTRLEYLINDLWHYGILRQDKITKKFFITNWKGDKEIERIEQLHVRIRKTQE